MSFLRDLPSVQQSLVYKMRPERISVLSESLPSLSNLYDLSFLKLSQLMLDGDVECNPGPVMNTNETPKRMGRPPKRSKFRGD